jgi:hypothetical protein
VQKIEPPELPEYEAVKGNEERSIFMIDGTEAVAGAKYSIRYPYSRSLWNTFA